MNNVLDTVKPIIKELGLKMQLVDAEFKTEGENKKLYVYFTAQKRINFNDLVRRIASLYRCRIEMRQITPRQLAKRLGGITTCHNARTPCFRPFCHKTKWGGCFYDREDCQEEKKVCSECPAGPGS